MCGEEKRGQEREEGRGEEHVVLPQEDEEGLLRWFVKL
jgi:hypothetical protein